MFGGAEDARRAEAEGGSDWDYIIAAAEQAVAATPEDVSVVGRFQYDFDGRRNLKIGEGVGDDTLRQYVYDDTSLLVEYDDAGLQKAKYDYGSDRLVALTRADEGRRYFSLDGLRSVVNLTDDSGSAVAAYHLDAWGNFRFPSELAASKNRFAFTGHIYDSETGLYNAKARYFDPKLGRFLTQDSFLGNHDNPPSLHRYAYGFNNPLVYIAHGDYGREFVYRLVGEFGAEDVTVRAARASLLPRPRVELSGLPRRVEGGGGSVCPGSGLGLQGQCSWRGSVASRATASTQAGVALSPGTSASRSPPAARKARLTRCDILI